MRHIITALVENQPGVLARIVGLISGRGYNIESLNVAPLPDADVSRMTITVPGDNRVLEQVTKQLNKLVNVLKVCDLTSEPFVERELAMIKVATAARARTEIIELVNLFRATIISVEPKCLMIQVAGTQEKIDNFVGLLKHYGIQEISRSGVIAMARNSK